MAGNLPVVTALLLDQSDNAVNLTGCTVQFKFQQLTASLQPSGGTPYTPQSFTAAAIVAGAPANGNVSYQFSAGQTNIPGDYRAQWLVTNTTSSLITAYPLPGGTLRFRIKPALQANPSNIVLINQMIEPVRVTLGDMDDGPVKRYSTSAILASVRTCLLTGLIAQQTITPDMNGISPGITLPSDMALLMYQAARKLLLPNVADYGYRLRGLQEKFGRQDDFLFHLDNAIYELVNGQMFSSFQSFYAWVNSLSGVDIWSLMSDMETDAPVATVAIGRAGVTVATT